MWEGARDRTETVIFWPHCYDRQRCVFLVLLMLGSTLLGAGFLYCLLSASSLDPNSSGPQGPFGLVWLSLPLSSPTGCNSTAWLLSWLSYIIVQCPLDRPRDLWNRMFNRHQAEITVMQFKGHSLPVRQSMRVSWDFFYLVPFHQPISAHAISSHNCHYNVSLPSGASPWMAFLAGSKGQNITKRLIGIKMKFAILKDFRRGDKMFRYVSDTKAKFII